MKKAILASCAVILAGCFAPQAKAFDVTDTAPLEIDVLITLYSRVYAAKTLCPEWDVPPTVEQVILEALKDRTGGDYLPIIDAAAPLATLVVLDNQQRGTSRKFCSTQKELWYHDRK